MIENEIVWGERVLLPDGFAPATLRIGGGRIAAVVREPHPAGGARVLPPGTILAPGFIDVQANGGGGVLFNDDPSPAALARIAAAHRAGGTTGLFATLITDRPGLLGPAAAAVAAGVPGVLGLHAEGPHISSRRPGVHPPEWIRPMTAADEDALAAAAAALPLLVTVAPETVEAAAIGRLARAGATIAAGHTEADAATIARAAAAGLRGATHLFNAMPPLASRSPGPVGAVLDHPALFAGVIADGIHVEAAVLRLAWRLLGPERTLLVTDAMPPAGTDMERFTLLGRTIRRRAGRLETEDGTLAGADLSMIGAVRFAHEALGAPLEAALRMASETPARFMGLADRGRIAPGAHADLVLLEPGLTVRATAVAGVWQDTKI